MDVTGIPQDLRDKIFAKKLELSQSATDTLTTALELGDLLLVAKNDCRHGLWLSWLKQQFDKSVRRAQEFMKLAREFPPTSGKARIPAHLTLDDALKLLSSKSKVKTDLKPTTHDEINQETLQAVHTTCDAAADCIRAEIMDRLEIEGLTQNHEAVKLAKRMLADVLRLHAYTWDGIARQRSGCTASEVAS